MKVISLIVLMSMVIIACTGSDRKNGKDLAADSILKHDSTYYTCTMHPNIISRKHGICPKCAMDLVKVVNTFKH